MATVNAINLNLHNEPNANPSSRMRITLPNGTRVRIIQTLENGWDKIVVEAMGDTGQPPTRELTGFVNGKLLTQVAASNPPSTPPPPTKQQTPEVTPTERTPPVMIAARSTAAPVTNSITNTANDVPSDGEVIAAIKAAWTAADNAGLANLKAKLQSAERQYSECPDKAAKECVFLPQVRNSYGVTRSPGWYQGGGGFGGFPYDTQNHCIQNSIQISCSSDFGAEEIKSRIADFQYRVGYYIFIAVRTNNYEGNIISYVYIRKQKTETIERYKVTFERQGNALVLLNMDSYSQ